MSGFRSGSVYASWWVCASYQKHQISYTFALILFNCVMCIEQSPFRVLCSLYCTVCNQASSNHGNNCTSGSSQVWRQTTEHLFCGLDFSFTHFMFTFHFLSLSLLLLTCCSPALCPFVCVSCLFSSAVLLVCLCCLLRGFFLLSCTPLPFFPWIFAFTFNEAHFLFSTCPPWCLGSFLLNS